MNHENAFIITTSSGEGLGQLFLELGADALIPLGDTGCPTEDDFLAAIRSSGSRSILVMPNDEAALLTAERAVLGLDFVRVLPTRSFCEGYVALASMPRGESIDTLYSLALGAISSFVAIEIACQSRGTMEERYSATSGGERYSPSASAEAALFESVERLICPHHRIITLIVGKGVTNSRRVFVTERLGELYPDSEIIVYIGGQTATEYYIALR
ncbi:MAG: hypothetical protein E7676_02260 [Ruminococcaceae bacterium]|nr:hypothetical protein [Oscillospiraceae bacterium]